MKAQGKGPAQLRLYNENRVLSWLRYHPVVSRQEIAVALALGKNTVSQIIDDFISQGYVKEIGTASVSGVGRPKIELALLPERLPIAGVSIEHQRLKWAICDFTGAVIECDDAACDTASPDAVLIQINRLCARFVQLAPALIGIGIGFPGIVDPVAGIIHYSSHLGWENVAVSAALDSPVPCYVMNSVKAAALHCRQGLSKTSIFYLRIGEGVGGALLMPGGIEYGASWTAGEIGHIAVTDQGPPCRCGQRGCLESLIRYPVMQARLNTPGLSEAQRRRHYQDAGGWLGKACSQVIHLINPHLLVIDTPYNASADFTQATRTSITAHTLVFPLSRTQIQFTEQRFDLAVGAALAVTELQAKVW